MAKPVKGPEDFGLGRIHSLDPRDHAFLMAMAVPTVAPGVTSKYWYANGWWGDQGSTPQCVAYSLTHWLEDGPITHSGPAPLIKPATLYAEAQERDEWPGSDYDGTSVRAGAKALQDRGLIVSYLWAFEVDTVVNALLTTGPVVVGTNWYQQMFYPNDQGLIVPGGPVAGGHAYKLDGANTKTRLIRIKNSWGRNWGKKGFAYITFDDMDRLIKEDGEAMLAVEAPDAKP